jgi:hypothetical protein
MIYRQEIIPHGRSIILAQSNHSATKLSKHKQKSINPDKKTKKNKHTISVINLSKGNEEPKYKNSSTTTKRKHSADLTLKIKEKIEDFRIISNCLD